MNFAKLFQVEPDTQLVIYMDYNAEDDHYQLHRISDVEGFILDVTAGFKSKEDCQKAFDSYDDAKAKILIDSYKELLAEAKEDSYHQTTD